MQVSAWLHGAMQVALALGRDALQDEHFGASTRKIRERQQVHMH